MSFVFIEDTYRAFRDSVARQLADADRIEAIYLRTVLYALDALIEYLDKQAACINERYEYTTRETPYGNGAGVYAATRELDDKMEADDWRRVWADTTMDGVFVVYRRERSGR